MSNKKKNKKGQVAMEFIITYGWAILVILIAIGGFIYIAPHKDSITKGRCIFSPATPCLGSVLTENLTVVLKNGLGQTLYNLTANITSPTNIRCNVSNITFNPDDKLTIRCNNNIAKISSESKVKMTVTYKKVKNGYDQVSSGEIYAK